MRRLLFGLVLAVLVLVCAPFAHAQSVVLNWNAATVPAGSPAVTSYQIWRGTTSGGEVLLVNPGLVLTYTDTTVKPGTTYFYEVFALNSVGPSKPSNEATAVVPAAQLPPNPPTITITITLPTT